MKRRALPLVLAAFFLLARAAAADYTPHSRYLLHPEENLQLIREELRFWEAAKDTVQGGFFAFVDRWGRAGENRTKSLCGLSRLAYAFVRGFQVTGDTTYLRQARHALRFLYRHGWDAQHGGWFFTTDEQGQPAPFNPWWDPNTWKWGFQQHYALVGIAAMVEATGGQVDWGDGEESDAVWLARGEASVNDHMWDARPAYAGYFTDADLDWGNPRGKGFTPTVDGITTNALAFYLLRQDEFHRERLLVLADAIVDHLVATMDEPAVQFGFVENFDSDWHPDWNNTGGSVGHLLKAAWCLARAYLVQPDERYRQAALRLIHEVWDRGGYDHTNGAPFGDYNWQTGAVQHTKVHWMVEQGYTAGMINFHIAADPADRDICLQMADESLDFHNRYLADTLAGGTFMATDADGAVVDSTKGDAFKSAYHSVELWYFAYLYGNLFYAGRPVTLYYDFPPADQAREVRLTPLAVENGGLVIAGVVHGGQSYADYDGPSRTLRIPPGEGGVFQVTFAPASPSAVAQRREFALPVAFVLSQNVPNPFRAATEFRYRLGKPAQVRLEIYDILGRRVAVLVRGRKPAGSYQVRWRPRGLPSGVYLSCLRVDGRIVATKKLQFIR